MTTKKTPDFDAAAEFLAASARVLDRRVFQRLFQGGPAEPVRDAVAAYRNDDGGFGHALEPDCRVAASQPAAVEMALRILDVTDSWDDDISRAACDWLTTAGPADGGVVSALPSVSAGPHAPWWVPEEGNRASPIQTGQLAGVLHARGVAHPWRERATDAMWRMIERLTEPNGYVPNGYVMFGAPPRRWAAWHRCCSTAAWSPWTRTRPGRCTGRWTSRRCRTRSPGRCSTTR
jgi:hypothetical protein